QEFSRAPQRVLVFHEFVTLHFKASKCNNSRPRTRAVSGSLTWRPTMQEPISRRSFALGMAGAAVLPTFAFAQSFPAKPITVVVAFSAGGNNDLRARQLGILVSN